MTPVFANFISNILSPLIDVNEAILRFWHNNVGLGWGLSIVMLTIVVRIAILPITYRGIRGMQNMQRLAPEMKKLQERYKDDKQRLNEEMMKFYQEHGFNPASSCLPLLLQIPFFISLFYLLRGTAFKEEIQGAGFLIIDNLSKPETGLTLVLLIVLYVGTQLAASLVTAVSGDRNQRLLVLALPLLFVPVLINFPAALLVYWITTNLWTFGQQLAVKKFLPPPEPLSSDDGDGKAPAATGRPTAATAATGDGEGSGKRRSLLAAVTARAEEARSEGGAGEARSTGGGSNGAAERGNGTTGRPPPQAPRKKKKRSGRRR